jgi:ABC-type dipeptide/oligopeptide/nickel transport system permease component
MIRFIVRRTLIIPIALILIHFLAFSYAHIAGPIRAARTPYLREQFQSSPLFPAYIAHVKDLLSGGEETLITSREEFFSMFTSAAGASLGLLGISMVISIFFGFMLGLMAVRSQPPGVHRWLTPLSTLGLAMPSFYLGSLGVLAVVYYVLYLRPGSPGVLPIKGFGWDTHLVMPAITLALRPTVQIAQMVAGLLSGELGKQYVIAARSFGHSWRNIRWKQAMRNILAPVLVTFASTLRLTFGELVVVEWFFAWPGLGELLASALVPGQLSTEMGATAYFLNPPIIAAVVVIISAVFLLVDLAASIAVRAVDPRMRGDEELVRTGGQL